MKKLALTFSLLVLCFTSLFSFSAQNQFLRATNYSFQTNDLKQVYIEKSVIADVEYDPVDLTTLKTIRDNAPLASLLKTDWADEGNVGIWKGVEWSNVLPRKVVRLTITNKNLLSLDVSALSGLELLDCSNNSLVALNITGLTKLKDLICKYNRLAFSRLPLSLPVTGGAYVFSPQNNLYEDRAIVAGETIDYSYEGLVNGISTVYTWYKDQVKIEGTDQSGKFTPTQEGFYACKMTNGSFPLLTLVTSNVKVGISEDFYPQDVSVLKAMRENAPSNSVLKTEWADESKIGTWNGVTWTDLKPRRVKGLLLQYKSLTEMDIADLSFLENLVCEYNNIPMSKLPIKLPVSGGSYLKFPQSKIFKEQSISIGTKIDYSSEITIGGKASTFTWYGCGIKINEADQSGSYEPTREGLYYCEIYSPYWGITETTNLVKVGNPTEYDPANVNALKAIRDNAPASSPLKTRWANDSQIAYWIGVEWSGMASKKVISLDLIGTNLEALDISQLTDIQRFFCDLNNLKSLDIRGLNHLVNFSCSGNKLRFSTFFVDSKFSSIKYKTYSPQDSWTDERTISLGEIIDFSSEASVNGVSTSYTWYRNNLKIEGTNQSGTYTPTEEGYYYCTMSNTSFPDLLLRSPMTKVGNPSDYDPIDVNALKKIRDDAPADSPLKTLWSDEALVGSWSGVTWSKTVKPYKVENLNVGNNKLTVLDVQPFWMLKMLLCNNNSIKKLDLRGMGELSQIACQSNELYELNISGIEPKITFMNCSSNRLTFSNLPRLSTRLCTFIFDVQNPYPEDKTITLGTTIDFSSEATIEVHNTVYVWYRNGEKITGTDSSGKYTPIQDGYYYCTMTNGRYTPLLIVSNAFKIGPDLGTYYQQDLTTLKAIRDNAPADSPLKTAWGDETTITTWKGVTWSREIPYRVISLNVSSSKLESLDVTPLSLLQILSCNDNSLTSLKVNGLSYLTQLFCTGNKLTTLDLTGTTKVNTLYIYSNKFTFSTLPPRTKGLSYYNNYSYGSQAPYSDSKTIAKGEVLDYSSQATINGVATQYTWYVGGLKLENTDQSGKYTPVEDGYYTCTITNASFPELTITTGASKLGEPAEYSQYDIDALKAIRENSPAGAYLRTSWADETKLSSWYGVSWSYVAPRRVISLNVTSYGLETLDVSKLSYLSTLNCYNNKLKSLSIAGTRVTNLICKFNAIPFSKLPLPLPAYSAETVIEYSPQNLIFDEQNIKLGETIDYSSEASIDGNPTIFTWYQNGVAIISTDQSGKYTPKVEDRFYCVLSNSKFPNLKLTTNKVTVGTPPTFDPVDIATLVAIRDHATEGSSIKTSWSAVSTAGSWQGVTWTTTTPRKVTYLDVSYSGLTSLDVSPLKLLRVLTCYNNQLKTINVKDLPNLIGMNCSNNFLPFTQLPISLPVSGGGYTYYPQGLLFEAKNAQLGEIIDYSSEVLIDGVSTVYTWYKNNVKIENVNQTGKYKPLTEGYYYCTLTNAKFPKLTLTTNIVKVGNPPEFDSVDVIALKSIRDQAPTGSILKSIWADDKNIGSWTGIDWTEKPIRRVVGLNLNSAGFVTINLGNLSAIERIDLSNNLLSSLDLSGLPSLKTVYCSYNKLTALNITGLSQLSTLYCYNNQLTFTKLPLFLPVSGGSYTYYNQSYPEPDESYQIGSTIDYSSEANVWGVPTKYTWYKNGAIIQGTDGSGKLTVQESGFYNCTMTNAKFPDLKITTAQIEIGNVGLYDLAEVAALKTIRDNAPADSPLKTQWADESKIAYWADISWSSYLPHQVKMLYLDNQKLISLDVKQFSALEQLNCQNNQLTTLDVSGLVNLYSLYCQNNQLSGIDISSLSKLYLLNCSNNKIPISKLPLKLPTAYGQYNYYPQNPFGELRTIALGEPIDYSSEAIVGGVSTSFTWYLNNVKIEGTDNTGKLIPVTEGFYTCRMSNSKLPDLTVTTGKVIVGNPVEFDPGDLSALKEIRDNAPVDSPLKQNWADEKSPATWNGVTWNAVYPLKVSSLNVSATKLVTLDVSKLKSLLSLDCSYNQLKDIKTGEQSTLSTLICSGNFLNSIDISGIPNLKRLDCNNNQISLSKLPLKLSVTGSTYRYSPQNKMYAEGSISSGELIDYSSEALIDGVVTVFSWYKNNNLIPNTDQSGKYTPTDDGYYYCQMTNSKFPGLIIQTNELKLGTPPDFDPLDIAVLKRIRDAAPANSNLRALWSDDLAFDHWNGVVWNTSRPKKVRTISVTGMQLTSLDASGLTELLQLYCNKNNLTSINLTNLPKLITLVCDDNQLNSIDLSGAPAISFLNLSNNKLPLSKLPWQFSFGSYIYSPQKPVFEEKSINVGEIIDYSSEVNIRGAQTVFTWYRNNVKIEGTDSSGRFSPSLNGSYYCIMTNYSLSLLTLTTNKVTVGGATEFDYDDLNTLKAIRDNALPGSALKTEWADESLVATWSGVVWTDTNPRKVKQLDVSNKILTVLNVSGLTGVERLVCSNNKLTELNIDGLLNLNYLDCSNNQIGSISLLKANKVQNLYCNNNSIFLSRLPVQLPVLSGIYQYSPMNSVGQEKEIFLGEAINLISESVIEGVTTAFTWFRNGVKLLDADQSGKYVPSIEGDYYCTMTNSKFPNLVITTKIIKVIRVTEYEQNDIEALRRLRDSAPSDSPLKIQWADDTKFNSWAGVTWSDFLPKKVKVLQLSGLGLKALDVTAFSGLEQLYCNNNQLTSIQMAGLLNLNYLSCSNNQLANIDISGLPKMLNLYCNENKFSFSKLPPKLAVKGGNYQYWPQKSIFDQQTIQVGETIDYSSEALIDGIQTSFTWYRDGSVISDADQTGKYVTTTDGNYYCTMANANFPGLTLTTNKVTAGKVYEFDQNDVRELKSILDNSPSSSFIREKWNDINNIGSWFGVKWNSEIPKRVIELDVSNCGLTSLNVTSLTKLERLLCMNNQLTSINLVGLVKLRDFSCMTNQISTVDLSGLTSIQTLNCANNKFPFSSLWANVNYLKYSGTYSPQNLVFSESTIGVGQTIDYSSESKIGGVETTFTWYRDSEKIDGTDNSGIYIPMVDGYYHCTMTNSKFPGLTISSMSVKVGSPIQFNLQDVEALKAIRNNAPETSVLKSKWGDETKIGTWEGVTWSLFYPKYVVSLSIHDAITDLDVTRISHLQELNVCSCLVLQSINISGLKELKMIDCRYNKIPFSKIPQSTSTLTCYFIPQYELYNERPMNLGEGIDYSAEQIIDGVQTEFTWYFNNTEILGTDQSGKYLPTLSGEYYCKMINSKFPGLTLQTSKITISDKIPVAKAGVDQIVSEGAVVTLDGLSSYVKGNGNLTYYWTAPSGVELSSIADSKPVFTAPQVLSNTNLTFLLVVSDGILSSVEDQVVITVLQVNKEPVANAGNSQIVSSGDLVELDGSGSFDVDNDVLTYSWSSPSGILISSTTDAKPTFTATNVSDDTSYTFKLTVNDGKLNSAVSEVIVTVRKIYPKIKLVAKLNDIVISVKDIKYQLFLDENNNFTEQSLIPEIKGDTTLFSLSAGKWIVLVSPSENRSLFIPTYLGDVLSWDQTTVVTISEPESIYKEIKCIQSEIVAKGSGVISGFIIKSDNPINKSIAIYHGTIDNKQPVKGAIINLYKKGDNIPVLSTISDADGFYKFEQLEISGYDICIELPGYKQSEKFAVMISDANPTIEVQFAVNAELKVITDIESIDITNLKVYPNPVTDNLSVDLMEFTGESVLCIYDVSGGLLLKQILFERKSDIDFSRYPAGSYIVKIFMNNQFKSFVIVK